MPSPLLVLGDRSRACQPTCARPPSPRRGVNEAAQVLRSYSPAERGRADADPRGLLGCRFILPPGS